MVDASVNTLLQSATLMDPKALEERIRGNVRVLKSLRGASDAQLAKAGGFTSRQVISARLAGRTEISSEDIARLAAALRVEPHVLLMGAEDALRWTTDHPDYKAPRMAKQRPNPAKRNIRAAET